MSSLTYFCLCLKRGILAISSLIAITCYCSSTFGEMNQKQNSQEQGKNKLDLRFWSNAASYDCSPDEPAYYVGGQYGLRLLILLEGKNPGDIEYTGVSDWTWPEGLKIEVCRSSSPNGPFIPSSALRDQMQFEFYVTHLQAFWDSLWRTEGKKPRVIFNAPEYHFAFHVPSELAGFYLCINVAWDHSLYGHLVAEKSRCMKIENPCTVRARDLAWGSQVSVAADQGRYDLAVALADSFVNMDWHDFQGLLDAGGAAKRLGHYDDAIRFLDICFEWNYTIMPSEDRKLLTAPTEANRHTYEQARIRLLELKEQQQDQNEER